MINCALGNDSSSFDSDNAIIFVNPLLEIHSTASNLFRMILIFKWPIMHFYDFLYDSVQMVLIISHWSITNTNACSIRDKCIHVAEWSIVTFICSWTGGTGGDKSVAAHKIAIKDSIQDSMDIIGWQATKCELKSEIGDEHMENTNVWSFYIMMTSSNGNIFRVTGHLCGKFTGPRWISRTKASDAELWCFLWLTSE